MNRQAGAFRWVVLGLISLGNFSPNYTLYQLSPLAGEMIERLSLTPSQFTSVFSASMVPAVFVSLIVGVLVDRFGARQVIGVGLLISALGTGLRLWAGSYATMFTVMAMSGVGASFLNATGAKIVGMWFPPEKISPMLGVFSAAATLGMMLAVSTTTLFPTSNSAFVAAAAISVVTALLWIVLMHYGREQARAVRVAAVAPIGESLRIVARVPAVWVVGLSLAMIMAAVVPLASFLPTALGGRGLDPVRAGTMAAVVNLGNIGGTLLSPLLAARLGRTKPILLGMGAVSAAGAAFAWLAPPGVLLWLSLFVTGLALGGMFPLLISIPVQLKEIGPLYAGTAGGVAATLQLLGAVTLPAYVLSPIAGTNFRLLYGLAGLCLVVMVGLVLLLPEVGKKERQILTIPRREELERG